MDETRCCFAYVYACMHAGGATKELRKGEMTFTLV